MIYFDTDVLVNALVVQDEVKHIESIELIKGSIKEGSFFISLLVLQELAFVLSKLKCSDDFIKKNLDFFSSFEIKNLDFRNFKRARKIAERISYNNINDCLHISIAEKNCKKIVTYNKKDFKKISKLTKIDVEIL